MIMENFVEILRDLLAENNLSLRKLEKETNINHSQLSRYLQGRTMRIDVALRLAKYFDCSLDYLFGLDNNKKTVKYTTYDYDLTGFVEKYKTLLARNSISANQFSAKYYLNKSIVSHWNSGFKPKMDVLYLIAKELNGSIDDLVGRY